MSTMDLPDPTASLFVWMNVATGRHGHTRVPYASARHDVDALSDVNGAAYGEMYTVAVWWLDPCIVVPIPADWPATPGFVSVETADMLTRERDDAEAKLAEVIAMLREFADEAAREGWCDDPDCGSDVCGHLIVRAAPLLQTQDAT